MSLVFSCCCNACSIYPSFSEVRRVRVDHSGSVAGDRLMSLSVTSAATLRQALLRRSHSPITFTCKYHLYTRHNSTLVMPEASPKHQPPIEVPYGFTLHSENTTHILLPSDNGAFLNPVQEFNRDLSVACIRVWSEEWNRAKEAKWRAAQEKKAKRPEKRWKGLCDVCTPLPAACGYISGVIVDSKNPEGSTEAKEKEVRFRYSFLSSNLDPDISSSFTRISSCCWKPYRLQGLDRFVTPRRSLW